jgi:RimJ/RimL family protein N-acetyltransferase
MEARDGEGASFVGVDGDESPLVLLITDLPPSGRMPSEVRVGYVVAEAAAGRGLATELLQGFAAWAAGRGAHRLLAGLDPANLASRRVLAKVGFQPDPEVPDRSVMVLDLAEQLPLVPGDGVILRPWRTGDAGDLHRAMQDPEIVRWMAIDLPYKLADAEGFIERTGRSWEERSAAHFVIEVDGRLAGYLGVLAVEERMGAIELGYWVAPEARGRGVAKAALRLAVDWAIRSLAPDRVELGMLAGNEASRRVAETTGFTFERTQPSGKLLDGHPADEWVFVLRQGA